MTSFGEGPANVAGSGKVDATRGPDAEFAAALETGRFLIQRCVACATHVFYPRVVCPYCGSAHLAWIEPCGLGFIYSVTIVRRRPEQGGDYNVVLVELAEGPRLMSRVDGISPHDVRIGMRVRAEIVAAESSKLIVFRPLEEHPA